MLFQNENKINNPSKGKSASVSKRQAIHWTSRHRIFQKTCQQVRQYKIHAERIEEF